MVQPHGHGISRKIGGARRKVRARRYRQMRSRYQPRYRSKRPKDAVRLVDLNPLSH